MALLQSACGKAPPPFAPHLQLTRVFNILPILSLLAHLDEVLVALFLCDTLSCFVV